jgi:hypothetical protein
MQKSNGIFLILIGAAIGAVLSANSSVKAYLNNGFQSIFIAAGFGIFIFIIWQIVAAIVNNTKISIKTNKHWLSELMSIIGALFLGLSCIWALFNKAPNESFFNAIGQAPTSSIAVLLLGVGIATLFVEVIVSRFFND